MHTSVRCYLVIVLIVTFQTIANCQYEGELCTHQKRGTNGVCKVLQQCPAAIADLRKGVYPQNCGFQGTVVVVCCPENGPTIPITTTTNTTAKTPVVSPPTGPLPVGEKSKRACQIYKKLAYKKEYSPVLAVGSGYDEVENCPWEPEALAVIILGTKTSQGEFPHMALIGYGTSQNLAWKCGGSLISDRFILTAAHCLYAKGFGEPKFVRLGDVNYTNPDDDQYAQQFNIKTLHTHPGYQYPQHYNDIALLELEKPANLNVYVKPACLQVTKSSEEPLGMITGWGTTEHGKGSDYLLKATVERFAPSTCNITYANEPRSLPRGIDADLQSCYGSRSNDKDSCQGDSGGPIQVYADVYCSYYVFGITSFGKGGCGHQTIPGVYVKVSSYIKWIEDIVWP